MDGPRLLDLKPALQGASLFTFECGTGTEMTVKGAVEGSVIAPLKPVDAMTEGFTLTYRALAGNQLPERFEGGLKDTLTTTLGTAAEQSGLTTKLKLASEEKLEVKGLVE